MISLFFLALRHGTLRHSSTISILSYAMVQLDLGMWLNGNVWTSNLALLTSLGVTFPSQLITMSLTVVP